MPGADSPAAPRDVRFVIIGTGFAGLGAAIALRRAGHHDLVVLERADDVGGTWRDNAYPGCRCDVESNLYSFSFAPNPDWSQTYSAQPELRSYLRDIAARYGVLPTVRFGHEVTAVAWDDTARRWRISTTRGEDDPGPEFSARYVIAGTGFLVEPARPEFAGIGQFAGTIMHSARWDPGWSAAGRLGSGRPLGTRARGRVALGVHSGFGPALEDRDLIGGPRAVAGHGSCLELFEHCVGVLFDVVERAEVECELHRLAVARAKQGPDVLLEAHRLVLFGQGHGCLIVIGWGGERGDPAAGGPGRAPVPVGHRHALGWLGAGLRVLQ